jgi:GT2 family glycosyltransferase
MAALTARSSHAYKLWIARDEQEAWEAFRVGARAAQLNIVPVIAAGPGSGSVAKTLASLAPEDAARAIILGVGTGHASGATVPKELGAEDDVWICPVQAGDQLAFGALSIYASVIAAAPEVQVLYGDDDLVDAHGERIQPHFKPDWNPDLFEHHDFVSGSAVLRTSAGAARSLTTGGTTRRLLEELLAAGARPVHVPLVLHHRVQRPSAVVPPKSTTLRPQNGPTISVIIPTRNKLPLLSKCLEGLRQADYPITQTIVVDNGSDEPQTLAYLQRLEEEGVIVLRLPGPFNYSVLNNAAVERCRGELLCFLNNDIEMVDHDWLSLLVAQAMREDIGAVGPRLLYPDTTVQHAGVVTGIGGGAAHAHRLQPIDAEGYFNRARLPQRVSAVTAACMVLDRRKFLAVGGFDEENFPVAFNDVDLCLKLNASGWESFYEPRSTLIHHESKSRGRDKTKVAKARFAGELAALKRKWRTDELRDPYHHPHLSRYTEQFLLSI